MAYLAFPLRLEGGLLRRCEEPEAVISLMEIMAWTPYESWAGCKHFGLRDFFEQDARRPVPSLPERAVREINLALEELGVAHYRLRSLVRGAEIGPGMSSFVVTLHSTVEDARTHSFCLQRAQSGLMAYVVR